MCVCVLWGGICEVEEEEVEEKEQESAENESLLARSVVFSSPGECL